MSFDLILFGGTGDLAWRKLMPALLQAHRHGTLPEGGRIIGVGREELSHAQYRQRIAERFGRVEGAKQPTAQEFTQFAELLHYQRMDLSTDADYPALAANLLARAADTVVMYLATAPNLFAPVVQRLDDVGLGGRAASARGCEAWRIVLEKPLGHDLASNRAINDTVLRAFAEHQVFRIDHYLGKPSVQNLLALRFGNALFEPLWRREHIAHMQITLAEELGVEQRGSFYDNTGALRDMVQNHALQLLCALAMEPPASADADAIRDEKLKVLRSLAPWDDTALAQHAVRGQYAAGHATSGAVLGYAQEAGVSPGSTTETFVALRAQVCNWRWAGVPFYLRTGKRLAAREARIEVHFRPVPHTVFATAGRALPNRLVIHLQPRDGIELHLMAQGDQRGNQRSGVLSPVRLDLDFDRRFGAERVGAYERLLLDVLAGRLNLFVRRDEQEAAWAWVEPLLAHWRASPEAPRPYAAGSWGPGAATAMLAREGHHWSEDA
jgi:glucose-6-phosphate 1-dehydrogenase